MTKLLSVFCFLLCNAFVASVEGKDIFKIAANSHYVSGYWFELVSLALDRTSDEFGEYDIQVYNEVIGNERHRAEMLRGELINARIGLSTLEREQIYLPIKIPLRKGLLNYRLLVARKDKVKEIERKFRLSGLDGLKIGLVESWVTSSILRHHEFQVITIADSSKLFRLLLVDRYEVTLRGANEVYTELEIDEAEGEQFAIVPNFGVYIASPSYIFVSKQAPGLAERIEKGLELLIEDGTFDDTFYKWHADSIEKAQIDKRTFIQVDNPFLPTALLPTRKSLWLNLD